MQKATYFFKQNLKIMKPIILTLFVIFFIGSFSQTSCTYDQIEPNTVCDTTIVATFSGVVQPILENYCTNCHSGSNPQGDIDLSSWAATEVYALSGSLVGSIARENGYSEMPKNSNKISECEIQKVRKWVLAGSKND
jgi:hypothetical protein